jgi:hypothetical protein
LECRWILLALGHRPLHGARNRAATAFW